mgnify:CR=1 FL=1
MLRAMLQPRNAGVGERRSRARQRVLYRLDVVAGDGSNGCLLDVSAAGLRVRFKQALDVGAIQSLRIEFPLWLELGSGLEVHGRFVWVRTTQAGATEAGFAFDELPRKVASVLEVLVQRLSEALVEDDPEAC